MHYVASKSRNLRSLGIQIYKTIYTPSHPIGCGKMPAYHSSIASKIIAQVADMERR